MEIKKQSIKKLIHKYNHVWVLLYFFIYIIWFFYLNRKGIILHPVESVIDQKIPFNECFIIPYYLWFAYIPIVIGYFFFTSKEEFYHITAFLFLGMTICLIVYTIWPNAVFFRPNLDELERDNILIHLTAFIYKADTGANVCPSIHCFNSIGVMIAIFKSKQFKKHIGIKTGSAILSVSICMSTVFVKQHSIIDVFWAIILAAVMYLLVYVPDYKKLASFIKQNKNSIKIAVKQKK